MRFYDQRPLMRDNDTPHRIIDFMRGEADEVEAELTDTPDRERIAYELADVVIYALCLSEVYGIDLLDAVLKKIEFNEERFPAYLFDYSSGDDFNAIYLARKRELGERE